MISQHIEQAAPAGRKEGAPDLPPLKESAEVIAAAVMAVRGLMADLHVMGGNDFEMPTLLKIIDDMENDRLSTKEGLQKAQEIAGAKQDYH